MECGVCVSLTGDHASCWSCRQRGMGCVFLTGDWLTMLWAGLVGRGCVGCVCTCV